MNCKDFKFKRFEPKIFNIEVHIQTVTIYNFENLTISINNEKYPKVIFVLIIKFSEMDNFNVKQ